MVGVGLGEKLVWYVGGGEAWWEGGRGRGGVKAVVVALWL